MTKDEYRALLTEFADEVQHLRGEVSHERLERRRRERQHRAEIDSVAQSAVLVQAPTEQLPQYEAIGGSAAWIGYEDFPDPTTKIPAKAFLIWADGVEWVPLTKAAAQQVVDQHNHYVDAMRAR